MPDDSLSLHPAAEMPIGDIIGKCVGVPRNISKILEPFSDIKLKRLIRGLERIENAHCGFLHEELTIKHKIEQNKKNPIRFGLGEPTDFVDICTMRGNQAGCGHQSFKLLAHAWQQESDLLDTGSPNNPIAKLQIALSLVLALGEHNYEAQNLIDDLRQEARATSILDRRAGEFNGYIADKIADQASLTPTQETIKRRIVDLQNAAAERVLLIRDKTLAMLAEDLDNLMSHEYKRKKSGTYKTATHEIRDIFPHERDVMQRMI